MPRRRLCSGRQGCGMLWSAAASINYWLRTHHGLSSPLPTVAHQTAPRPWFGRASLSSYFECSPVVFLPQLSGSPFLLRSNTTSLAWRRKNCSRRWPENTTQCHTRSKATRLPSEAGASPRRATRRVTEFLGDRRHKRRLDAFNIRRPASPLDHSSALQFESLPGLYYPLFSIVPSRHSAGSSTATGSTAPGLGICQGKPHRAIASGTEPVSPASTGSPRASSADSGPTDAGGTVECQEEVRSDRNRQGGGRRPRPPSPAPPPPPRNQRCRQIRYLPIKSDTSSQISLASAIKQSDITSSSLTVI
ncbi:hypothetical protein VTI74DRAFT_11176 [Chaetomium olivicolor]